MKRKLLVAASFVVSFVGLEGSAFATLILGPGQNIMTPGLVVVAGDKTFSNFSCSATVSGLGGPTDCNKTLTSAGILVIPIQDSLGNFGIRLASDFSATTLDELLGPNTNGDITLSYKVTAPAQTLSDIHLNADLHFSPSTPPVDAVLNLDIAETVSGGGGVVGTLDVHATNPPPIIVSNDSATFGGKTFQTLEVSKDIILDAIGTGTSPHFTSALASDIDQTFSQTAIPEPGTISLFGTALLGCVALFRRRHNKK